MKPQNMQMHCQISPRRKCNPCGYTMKMSSRHNRLLNYDLKKTTKIDGMGPFYMAKIDIIADYISTCLMRLKCNNIRFIHETFSKDKASQGNVPSCCY